MQELKKEKERIFLNWRKLDYENVLDWRYNVSKKIMINRRTAFFWKFYNKLNSEKSTAYKMRMAGNTCKVGQHCSIFPFKVSLPSNFFCFKNIIIKIKKSFLEVFAPYTHFFCSFIVFHFQHLNISKYFYFQFSLFKNFLHTHFLQCLNLLFETFRVTVSTRLPDYIKGFHFIMLTEHIWKSIIRKMHRSKYPEILELTCCASFI